MRTRDGRRDRVLRGMACAVAPLAPFAVVALLSLGPFAGEIVPRLVLSDEHFDPSTTIFVDLAKLMMTMSGGLALAQTWLYRQPLRTWLATLATWIVALAMLAALICFYAGLRFLFDLGRQLLQAPLTLDLLQSRLYWQGWALIAQVSLLSLSAVLYHFHRDARFRRDGGR